MAEHQAVTCKRCGHDWVPLVALPRVCPRCKSYRWVEERQPRGGGVSLPSPSGKLTAEQRAGGWWLDKRGRARPPKRGGGG